MEPVGIRADVLNERIDQFLGSRGYRPTAAGTPAPPPTRVSAASEVATRTGPVATEAPLDFVCEEDVRLAIRDGRTLLVSERAIITPSARELGEAHRVFSTPTGRR